MDSEAFTIVADRLCKLSDLSRIEARGTIRIAFKQAGVDVRSFARDELEAVISRVLPGELDARGCSDSQAICKAILRSLDGGALPETAARSSDEIMRRLGSA